MERMEGGKHLQQRRWGVGIDGILLGSNPLGAHTLENSEFWSQSHDGLFSGVLEAIHMRLFFWTEGRTSSIALQAEAKAGAVNV